MKVDPELISTALVSLLREKRVASYGAIPLKDLTDRWELTRFRSSDLSTAIEALHAQGRISFEVRRDGLWVRRRGEQPAMHSIYAKILISARRLFAGLALIQIQRRRGDGYSGLDRRITQHGPARL